MNKCGRLPLEEKPNTAGGFVIFDDLIDLAGFKPLPIHFIDREGFFSQWLRTCGGFLLYGNTIGIRRRFGHVEMGARRGPNRAGVGCVARSQILAFRSIPERTGVNGRGSQ
jgi:hypothetical protein